MGTGHQMYRPICLIKALQLNVQQVLKSGWKCCIVPKTTGQFQQSKVFKTSISPHVFLNRATHSARNKHVFFPYVHIWPYKKLQTKPVAHNFDETFLRSVSLVTALILK